MVKREKKAIEMKGLTEIEGNHIIGKHTDSAPGKFPSTSKLNFIKATEDAFEFRNLARHSTPAPSLRPVQIKYV